MDKKLPSVFANKIAKYINNNEKVYYSKLEDRVEKDDQTNTKINTNKLENNLNVNQKISKIFNSTKYVYKADVHISLKNGEINDRIIGRNSTHLITMDNKLIPISDIIDINFIEKENNS